ncbi:MAG: histidine phosphatase family protein [Caldilineaceae bacterium]
MTNNNQFTIAPPATQEASSGRNPEIRLLLVCQAEGLQSRYSELNSEDSGLTALGWEQTNSLARWIATHEKVDVLLSAPQLRSRLTAQRLGQVLGKGVNIATDLPSHSRVGGEQSSDRHHLFAPLHVHEQFVDDAAYLQFMNNLAGPSARLFSDRAKQFVSC